MNLYEPHEWYTNVEKLMHGDDIKIVGITGLTFHERHIINRAEFVKAYTMYQ